MASDFNIRAAGGTVGQEMEPAVSRGTSLREHRVCESLAASEPRESVATQPVARKALESRDLATGARQVCWRARLWRKALISNDRPRRRQRSPGDRRRTGPALRRRAGWGAADVLHLLPPHSIHRARRVAVVGQARWKGARAGKKAPYRRHDGWRAGAAASGELAPSRARLRRGRAP